jgi:hypothetical protein
MLAAHGEFFPFARVVGNDGRLAAWNVADDCNEHKATLLYDHLRRSAEVPAKQGRFRAVALCSNVTAAVDGRRTSGIRVVLEHCSGAAFEVVVPYTFDRAGTCQLHAEKFRQILPSIFVSP